MAENPELEAAILAAPDDLAGYERYGRWLEDHGDPRSVLVLGQCARERTRSSIHLDGWDRQSAEVASLVTPERIQIHTNGVEWRRCFVEHITLAILQQPTDEVRNELVTVLSHPHLRFLRRLSLGASFPSMPEVDFGWVFAARSRGAVRYPHRARHGTGESVPRLRTHGLIANQRRPPNSQLCTSMWAYLAGSKIARASAGPAARIRAAVPSHAVPSSESSGP
jgi:uncharacterized protein (TIGR02996 family)